MLLEHVVIALRSDSELLFVAKWFVESQTCEIVRGLDYIELLECLPDVDCSRNSNEIACEHFDDIFYSVVDVATKLGLRCLRVSLTCIELDVMNDSRRYVRDTRCFVD